VSQTRLENPGNSDFTNVEKSGKIEFVTGRERDKPVSKELDLSKRRGY